MWQAHHSFSNHLRPRSSGSWQPRIADFSFVRGQCCSVSSTRCQSEPAFLSTASFLGKVTGSMELVVAIPIFILEKLIFWHHLINQFSMISSVTEIPCFPLDNSLRRKGWSAVQQIIMEPDQNPTSSSQLQIIQHAHGSRFWLVSCKTEEETRKGVNKRKSMNKWPD